MTEEHNHDEERIVLLDEEGNEHHFAIVDSVEIDDVVYVALLPEVDPEQGAVVFRVDKDDEGEDILSEIEDDEEYDRVVEAFEEGWDDDDLQ